MVMSILAAFILALAITLIFAPGYRRGSVAPLIIFFLVLFMAGVASQYWIMPIGPMWWGISWMPLLFILVIFTFLFATPSPYQGRSVKTNVHVEQSASAAETAISIFAWLLLLMLLVVIVIGIVRTPAV
jgi:hypothetical protein